jgi:hypothetical protein
VYKPWSSTTAVPARRWIEPSGFISIGFMGRLASRHPALLTISAAQPSRRAY